jgi:hypothetical protein
MLVNLNGVCGGYDCYIDDEEFICANGEVASFRAESETEDGRLRSDSDMAILNDNGVADISDAVSVWVVAYRRSLDGAVRST